MVIIFPSSRGVGLRYRNMVWHSVKTQVQRPLGWSFVYGQWWEGKLCGQFGAIEKEEANWHSPVSLDTPIQLTSVRAEETLLQESFEAVSLLLKCVRQSWREGRAADIMWASEVRPLFLSPALGSVWIVRSRRQIGIESLWELQRARWEGEMLLHGPLLGFLWRLSKDLRKNNLWFERE